jgi:myo-inositol-1(or 4)-monophosphatase
MTEKNKSIELKTAVKAAKEGGKILLQHYGKVKVRYKKDRSFVTEADILSEEKIKSILKKQFPDYSFLGEESGLEDNDSEYTWIIDPLDGTTNYSIMNPFYNVSVALARKNEPVLGVVFSPAQNELFHAEKNIGAYLNNRKIRVSKKKDLKTSFIGFCHAHDKENTERISEIFPRLKNASDHVRQIGAAELELSYVAAGRIEAFIMLKQNPWDTASGSLLVKEAGGIVTDISGKPFDLKSFDLVASNGLLHKKVLELVK